MKTIFGLVAGLVLAKVLVSMVVEYVNYCPPNFDSAFLIGREDSFFGVYAPAFYVHIVVSPAAFLIGAYLMVSGKRKMHGPWHRRLGKVQLALVVALVVPSGIVMACWAFSGPIAGVGFALQAILTGVTVIMAAKYAMQRKFVEHQRYATYCFLLLVSPLLFRIASGVLIVTGNETLVAYQLNAWLCWIVPLAIYEVRRRRKKDRAAKQVAAEKPAQEMLA
ncbi:DUF2306 domain-containing protein [bacterium]|nr:DUF2306 domain-containing protein [bacterium]